MNAHAFENARLETRGTQTSASVAAKPVAWARLAAWRFAPALLALVWLFPSLGFPLHNDATIFVQGGAGFWDGHALYRDFWDIKPPSIYLVNALPAALPPAFWALGFYALNIVVVMLGTQGLATLARRLGGPRAVWPTLLTSLLALLASGSQALGQCETWATVLAVGALLIWTRPAPLTWIWSVVVGVLAALIVSFKPTSLLPLLPLLLLSKRTRANWLLAILGGTLVGVGIVAAMKSGGIWNSYLEIQQGFVVPYVATARMSVWERFTHVVFAAQFWVIVLWLPISIATLALWKPDRTRILLGLSLGAGALALWVQNHLFPYQWQTMLLQLSLLTGLSSARLLDRLDGPTTAPRSSADRALNEADARQTRGAKTRDAKTGDQISSCAAAALRAAHNEDKRGETQSNPATRRRLFSGMRLQRFIVPALVASWLVQESETWGQVGALAARVATGSVGDFNFVAARDVELEPTLVERRIARYVRANSRPDDTLWVWGYAPVIHVEAQRRPPGRFFHHPALTVPFCPPAWRDETWQAMRAHPPRFIVIADNDILTAFGVPRGLTSTDVWKQTAIYPWFVKRYQPLRVGSDDYRLWELKPAPKAIANAPS